MILNLSVSEDDVLFNVSEKDEIMFLKCLHE
jgi:hypothetical protein